MKSTLKKIDRLAGKVSSVGVILFQFTGQTQLFLVCSTKNLGKLDNQQRLCFNQINNEGLPIGSGAMESAIRRVVNLGLKSASTGCNTKKLHFFLSPERALNTSPGQRPG